MNKDTGEKQEETCFIDLKAFGRTAEIAGEYLKKGAPHFVEGRLTQYKWEDESGNPRSKHSVTIDSIQLLPKGNGLKGNGLKGLEKEEHVDESLSDDIPF